MTTSLHDMVDEGGKKAPLGAGVDEVDRQDTQTDGHAKHYQELDLAKKRGVNMQLSKLDYVYLCEKKCSHVHSY